MKREPWVFLMRVDDGMTFEQVCGRAAALLRYKASRCRVGDAVLSYGGDRTAVLTYNVLTED